MSNEFLLVGSETALESSQAIIDRLRTAIQNGAHWYLAFLDAVSEWRLPNEEVDGRVYDYLIADEAFDWLVLAERFGEATIDLVPENELMDLLFHGRPPISLTMEEFGQRIGPAKYRAYLNYLYGVLVEEALIMAVEAEVQKEQRARAWYDTRTFESVFQRIYGATEATLFRRFRSERNLPATTSMSYHEHKEFTYWLFKYRLKQCHRARVASDTRKGLEQLKKHWALRERIPEPPDSPQDANVIDVPVYYENGY